MDIVRGRWAVAAAVALMLAVGTGIMAWRLWQENAGLKAELESGSSVAAKPVKSTARTSSPEPAQKSSSLSALREQVVKLNRENAALKREIARIGALPKSEPAEAPPDGRHRDWNQMRQEREKYMEKLKETDPERYEKMMKEDELRRKQWQEASKRFESLIVDQNKFLKELDTSRLTEEQQERVGKMIAAVGKMNELSEKIAATEDQEERRNLERQRFEAVRDAAGGFEAAREAALDDLGKRLGYSDEEGKQFSDYVNYIYDMTSMGRMFRGPGGPGGSPGGPGGRPR